MGKTYVLRSHREGDWPSYDVYVDGGQVNHHTDLVGIMSWFARVAFQPGDTIHWESAEPFTCSYCYRDEQVCSQDPCNGVLRDRGELA